MKIELEGLYTSFHKCLDLRDKYMELSLQRPSDNPKDSKDWKIYPPHVENRKGKEVGGDFEFEKCEIPVEHEVCMISHLETLCAHVFFSRRKLRLR
jgi:AMP deaminase